MAHYCSPATLTLGILSYTEPICSAVKLCSFMYSALFVYLYSLAKVLFIMAVLFKSRMCKKQHF